MIKKETCNISTRLARWAEEKPETPALLEVSSKKQKTFKELEHETSLIASGLIQSGMKSSNRVLLMVPYGIDFVMLTFAMFKAGLVPVLIDPGQGRKNTLDSIQQIKPDGMIATPLAHAARKIFPDPFKSIKHYVSTGWFGGCKTLRQVLVSGKKDFKLKSVDEEDPAAILFTSGSTGPAKGVLYTHSIFNHQVKILQEQFDIHSYEIDLPTFPLFGLFSCG